MASVFICSIKHFFCCILYLVAWDKQKMNIQTGIKYRLCFLKKTQLGGVIRAKRHSSTVLAEGGKRQT
jgi:hypothetical protein